MQKTSVVWQTLPHFGQNTAMTRLGRIFFLMKSRSLADFQTFDQETPVIGSH